MERKHKGLAATAAVAVSLPFISGLITGCAEQNSGKNINQQPASNTPQTYQLTPEELEIFLSTSLIETVEIQEKRVWNENDKPRLIGIPGINFAADIQQVDDKKLENDVITYQTPDDGIATPKKPLPKNIYIFGHSRWNNRERDFSKIAELKHGDIIIILNEHEEEFIFVVEKIKILNRENYLPLENDLSVILQITLEEEGKEVIDKDKIIDKVENPQEDGENLALLVIAKPALN